MNSKIKFLKERVDTFTTKTDEIQLFLIDKTVQYEELVSFCKDLKHEQFHGAMFHVFAFFDDENYAEFPVNPITTGYAPSDDKKAMEHIKAVYVYNQVNGFSRLTLYEMNESKSLPYDVDI